MQELTTTTTIITNYYYYNYFLLVEFRLCVNDFNQNESTVNYNLTTAS